MFSIIFAAKVFEAGGGGGGGCEIVGGSMSTLAIFAILFVYSKIELFERTNLDSFELSPKSKLETLLSSIL